MKVPTPIRYLRTITKHVEKHFGPGGFVLHEQKSEIVHVDVHVVPPTLSRPHFTVLTSGMSDLDMQMPSGLEDLALAEVCLCLPESWPLSQTNFGWREPEYSWPIRVLQQVARYPHREKTWFACGHTIGSVERPEPVDLQGRFTGLFLTNPKTFPNGADRVTTDEDGGTIYFLAVIPLLQEELEFARNQGSEELEDELTDAGVTELLDPKRASVV